MKEDFKNVGKLMLILGFPFLFLPLAVSCQDKETRQRIEDCHKEGGKAIVSPRNVVAGCLK